MMFYDYVKLSFLTILIGTIKSDSTDFVLFIMTSAERISIFYAKLL